MSSIPADVEFLAEEDGAEAHGDDGLEDEHRRHRRLQRAGVEGGLLQQRRDDAERNQRVRRRGGQQPERPRARSAGA